MNEEDLLQWAEDYLLGRLTESERTTFEQQLQHDEELAEMLEILRIQRAGTALEERQILIDHIRQWREEFPYEPTAQPMFNWKKALAAAAACLALLAMLWWVFTNKTQPSQPVTPDQLRDSLPPTSSDTSVSKIDSPFAASGQLPQKTPSKPTIEPQPNKENVAQDLVSWLYQTPDDYLDDPNAGNATKPSTSSLILLEKGIEQFDSTNYKSAIAFFEQIPLNSTDYYKAERRLAHAYLLDKNWDAAALKFEQMLSRYSPHQSLYHEAEWNLLIILLSKAAYDRAQKIYDSIIQDKKHTYHANAKAAAQKIIEMLKK